MAAAPPAGPPAPSPGPPGWEAGVGGLLGWELFWHGVKNAVGFTG